jgi:uncharacterized peroxidase-related enzyme
MEKNMTRLPLIDPATATGPAADLLAQVQKGMGMVPNMTRAMANSPAVLKGYLGLAGALSGGTLNGKTREAIALSMAQNNDCDYCLSAHTVTGPMAGLTDAEVLQARNSTSDDAKLDAILTFTASLTENLGEVTDAEVAAVRAAGVNDAEIAEIVGHVGLNVLTNYFNKAVNVAIDFPRVTGSELAAA